MKDAWRSEHRLDNSGQWSVERPDYRATEYWTTMTSLSSRSETVVVTAVMLLIVVGNSLVIAAITRDRRRLGGVQNYLIASLAVSDLLIGQSARPFVFRLRLSLSCLRVVGSRTSVVVQYRTSRRWNFRGRIKLGG